MTISYTTYKKFREVCMDLSLICFAIILCNYNVDNDDEAIIRCTIAIFMLMLSLPNFIAILLSLIMQYTDESIADNE